MIEVFKMTDTMRSANFGPPMDRRQCVKTPTDKTLMLDVSELYRPENRSVEKFRIYDINNNDPIMKRVYETYLSMHSNMTVDFVMEKQRKWLQFNRQKMTIMDALYLLNNLVDASDPDVDVPNIYHAFQTAERIRERHPHEDWFHLTGLIHDLGKVMALWGEPQWAVVGDTYPVGCEPAQSVVFRDNTFYNKDMDDERYNTKLGIYTEGCGLDQLIMSWGHDEYFYRVLRNHKTCTLPDEALNMIRFHSFYPWHTGGDYWQFANDKDKTTFYWVKEFNKFDLYSKSDEVPDVEKLTLYYQSLIDKYIPGEVSF